MSSSSGNLASLAEQLRTARTGGGAFRLPPRLLVRLSGKDAFRYLNGQVTRNLNRLSAREALPACLLTPKGKLCAPMLISRDGEDLLIEADPALEESLMARLDRYIVADEVTLSVEPPKSGVHYFGEVALSLLGAGIAVSRLGVPGVDLDQERGRELIDPRVIETVRIERGIPAWGSEMSEEMLPPEVGLERTHIDYDRGCYPGQETISRLKSIGRVRRLLHTLRSLPGEKLKVGMTLLDGEKKEIGVISSAAEQYDSGSWVALAILPRDTTEPLFALEPLVPLTEEATPISIAQLHGS